MTAIVLASASASRAALLRAAGVDIVVTPSGVDEAPLKARLLGEGAGPEAIAGALAEAKALDVSRRVAGLVIGADQTLALDGGLYDKPCDAREARERLMMLRGREHMLHSAVCVARDGEALWRTVDTAHLVMRAFSGEFLEGYLNRQGEALLASVGAYFLEGEGVQLFDSVDGDYFSILGLPLLGLLGFLRQAGALPA